MMWLVVGVLLTVVLLMLVASIVPGLRIDGSGSALIAAVIARVIRTVAGFALTPALAPYMAVGGWVGYVVGFVIPVTALTVATDESG